MRKMSLEKGSQKRDRVREKQKDGQINIYRERMSTKKREKKIKICR